MKDLKKLAAEHNIEGKLYSGGALEQIYNILGDIRLTKWLTITSEKDLDDKQSWSELIDFLEKNLSYEK